MNLIELATFREQFKTPRFLGRGAETTTRITHLGATLVVYDYSGSCVAVNPRRVVLCEIRRWVGLRFCGKGRIRRSGRLALLVFEHFLGTLAVLRIFVGAAGLLAESGFLFVLSNLAGLKAAVRFVTVLMVRDGQSSCWDRAIPLKSVLCRDSNMSKLHMLA